MKRLNRYLESLNSIYTYFKIDKYSNAYFPIIDCRDYAWSVVNGGTILLWKGKLETSEKVLNIFNQFDYTAIMIDAVDCRYIGIFDNILQTTKNQLAEY